MEPYSNLSRNSGVVAYEIGETSIRVKFKSGKIYVYNATKPGLQIVSKMQDLAVSGKGLSRYIGKYVRENYFSWE